MPTHAEKRRCAVPGCRAWARRGGTHCAAHSPDPKHWLRPLFALLERAPSAEEDIDEARLIDDEVRMIARVRQMALAWAAGEAGAGGGEASLAPAEFLRLWNALAGRMSQLLQARQKLRGASDGSFGALMDQVYDAMEALLSPAGEGDVEAPECPAQQEEATLPSRAASSKEGVPGRGREDLKEGEGVVHAGAG